jgi:hypothetical protein
MAQEEEKKQEQEATAAATDKVRLDNSSTTTHGDKVSVTEHGEEVSTTVRDPKTTTRTEQAIGGFRNADGTPNETAQKEFEERRDILAKANDIDPATGKVDKKYVSDILGVDPEVMRKKREEEMALNRAKQKESALYDSLSVLGDMITAATGGNVWKRDKNTVAKNAHDNNLALQKEQQEEDIANNKALRAPEKEYAAAVAKLYDTVSKANSTKVSTTTENGGGSKTTTTQGNDKTTVTQGKDVTTGHRDVVPRGSNSTGSRSASGSDKSSTRTVKIQVKNQDGTISSEDFHIPANDFDAMARYLSAVYNNLSLDGRNNINNVLANHSILPKDKSGQYTGEDLLSSGIVFDDPQIRSEFIKVINQDQNRTSEEKQRIISIMNEYPSSTDEAAPANKKSWWQKVKDWFHGEDEQEGEQDDGWGEVETTQNDEQYDI